MGMYGNLMAFYCYLKTLTWLQMVGCENGEKCPREWVGVTNSECFFVVFTELVTSFICHVWVLQRYLLKEYHGFVASAGTQNGKDELTRELLKEVDPLNLEQIYM
jgi:hypothetical protein